MISPEERTKPCYLVQSRLNETACTARLRLHDNSPNHSLSISLTHSKPHHAASPDSTSAVHGSNAYLYWLDVPKLTPSPQSTSGATYSGVPHLPLYQAREMSSEGSRGRVALGSQSAAEMLTLSLSVALALYTPNSNPQRMGSRARRTLGRSASHLALYYNTRVPNRFELATANRLYKLAL